ncbi:MAG TPA: glutamate--tRNA ligase [Cytophagales bacterium]|jgi:glutamyl-tRNA synthetase|nr:glutamate--tRNA ligase [Cytophagales bacterium]
MSDNIRLRFAPSPTGPLHIGGLRTALYNYLISKKSKGKFILRIEDTDLKRYNKKAEKHILDSLKWCGISPDESPEKPGNYGPYRQSERKNIYKKFIAILIKSGNAYFAFDKKEKLEEKRKKCEKNGETFIYNWHNRLKFNNSLSIRNEKTKKLTQNNNYVVRFKTVHSGKSKNMITVNDEIRGKIQVDLNNLDDKIICKSDGMPTYHLANVVDDYLMKITHVIRGEEWLPSLALHCQLYNAFGWEKPKFAHLPLILKPTGTGKLSKRDGEKYRFPVYPIKWKDESKKFEIKGFKELGYESKALINFICFIGWNPGNENEILSLNELIENFSINRIIKSGAKYDIEKAKWFNQSYVRKLPNKTFKIILENKINISQLNSERINKIIELLKERLTFKNDILIESNNILEEPKNLDKNFINKEWSKDLNNVIIELNRYIKENHLIKPEKIKDYYLNQLKNNNIKIGIGMQALRLCIIGKISGPDLFIIIEILGNSKINKRISKTLNKIND